MQSPRDVYQQRIERLSAELAALSFRYDVVAWSRLGTLVVAVALFVATLWRGLGTPGWIAGGVAVIAFFVLVAAHSRIARKRDRALAARGYNERGIDRLDGKWTSFAERGDGYVDDSHGYSLDLDIFGSGSLFQRVNEARTEMGKRALARWLSDPAGVDTIRGRQEAAAELSKSQELRESSAVAGARASESGADPEPLLIWAQNAAVLRAPLWLRVWSWCSPIALIALASASSHPFVPIWAFLIPYVLNLLLLQTLGNKMRPVIDAVSDRSDDLVRFGETLALMESHPFEATALRGLTERLRASGSSASIELARLARLVSILDARRNGAFRAIIGPAFMWDVHCVVAIEGWQTRAGRLARDWLNALGDFEALLSFGTLLFENPSYAFPKVSDGSPHFEAAALGHPLIEEDVRVLNDVSFPGPGSMLLVTGSNMSGKSTLLRSVGVGAVLAMAGAPVCAAELRLSACIVRSSMRVSDSLRDGISRFYAELLKIKRVSESAAQETQPVLFLLDEILHGTNSRERHIGARSVIRSLIAHGAMGAVSTHDLALAALADAHPEKIRVVHFQEQVADGKMTFDYRLREGVVRSGNALRWMRLVGLEVDDSEN